MANIIYFATLPIVYTGGVTCTHKVGAFVDENDAIVASKIVKNVLENRKDIVEHTEYYSISKQKFTEDIKGVFYNNVDEFVAKNMHTQRYVSDKGQEALDYIVNETLASENSLSR